MRVCDSVAFLSKTQDSRELQMLTNNILCLGVCQCPLLLFIPFVFHSLELYCILSYFGVYSLILLGLFHLHLPILSDFHFCPNFHQIESDLIQTKIKGIPTLAARPSSLRFVLQDVLKAQHSFHIFCFGLLHVDIDFKSS